MKPPLLPQPSIRKSLRPGQTLHFHASSGLIVIAAAGTVRLAIAPGLATEPALRQTVDLCEGEAHVVQEDGWLAISAQHPAEVACVAEETWNQALWRHCRTLAAEGLRRWRRVSARLFAWPATTSSRTKP